MRRKIWCNGWKRKYFGLDEEVNKALVENLHAALCQASRRACGGLRAPGPCLHEELRPASVITGGRTTQGECRRNVPSLPPFHRPEQRTPALAVLLARWLVSRFLPDLSCPALSIGSQGPSLLGRRHDWQRTVLTRKRRRAPRWRRRRTGVVKSSGHAADLGGLRWCLQACETESHQGRV
jgi:hypothetical protein